MAISKSDAAIGAFVLLLLLGGRKVLAATTSKPGASPPPPPPPKPPVDPKKDGDALMKRANQAGAASWAVTFASVPDHPISPLAAAALARWAGIESSGKATNTSRLNERGLMQAGPTSVAEGELTPEEWAALTDQKTTKAQHAAIAIKYVDALAKKAFTYVARPPVDPVEIIWYAKLWHQRPVDVRDAGLTGDAIADAGMLAQKWAGDNKALHRLRAANVVAFGTPTP